jgi:phosphatidate cytidylyltransferase
MTGQRWSDFGIRLASAAVLGPIALFALWYGGIAWAMLIGVAMAGLGLEWARLSGLPGSSRMAVLPLLAWLVALFFGFVPGLVALAVLAAFALWRYGKFAAAGVPYIGIGGLSLLWLRLEATHGLHTTLFLVVAIWATDIGAYLLGRLVGGKKLAPAISPGKTWSGAFGGLLAAAVGGCIVSGLGVLAIAAAIILSLAGQAGDLLESAIKRKLGVKDSGRTIPGHGGLFDRLDGFLTAAPVAAILAFLAHGFFALFAQGFFALFAHGGLRIWH